MNFKRIFMNISIFRSVYMQKNPFHFSCDSSVNIGWLYCKTKLIMYGGGKCFTAESFKCMCLGKVE